MKRDQPTMTIGALAASTGSTPSAIRYYETLGLLEPAARASGRRRYAPAARKRLQFVRLAQRAGFSLAQIRALVRGERPWRDAVQDKLEELASRQAAIAASRRVLRAVDRCTDARPAALIGGKV